MEAPKENPDDKSRDEVLKELAAAEEKLYGWTGKLDFNEQKADDAEAQLDSDTASLLENSEDPPLLGKLWHSAQKTIISKVKIGKIRSFILSEKGLFLRKRANTKDQKFGFKKANQEVWDVVDNWVRSNAEPIELGMAFWDLNDQYGYHPKSSKSR